MKGIKKSTKNQKIKERGITLIALVITIIVLLILAGVALATLTGDSGILSNAEKAKEQTNLANSKEQVQLAIQGALTEGLGIITKENLVAELDRLLGAGTENYTITPEDETGPWTVTVTDTGYSTTISSTGKKEDNGQTKPTVDWEAILAEANANPESFKHEETLSSTYIAIGTDGRPVDMDMWVPTPNADGTFSLGSMDNYGSEMVYTDECPGGKIKGTVPQYIYNEELETFKEVVRMYGTFFQRTDLMYAPEIPSSVKEMLQTFKGCTELNRAPEIPSTVTDMGGTFSSCTNLTTAPEIPSSVTKMTYTFYGCTNLTGTIVINANPTNYGGCFEGTVKPITLTNSATEENTATETTLNNLKGTTYNGNVSVVLAK